MDADLASTVITVAVLGFMATRLVGGVRASRSSSGRAVVSAVLRRLRWRHVWPIPIVLTAVIVVASALMAVPGLDWGWWTAVGGEGNPVFGSSEATAGTVWEWVVPAVFMVLLVPALPLFAHAEERLFRRGAEHWNRRRRVGKTVQFGLVHAIVGIPIGAALALSLGGAYFLAVYLRAHRRGASTADATLESTTAHTAYNGAIIVIVLGALAATAVIR
ncbi:MAG: hypothetical protein KDB40_18025 [Acidimicrobiales bacterium]|nr:hypothetical protein [Acidimicrobiales bacterium]MCB9394756.1 hypothetical protein [Acidimicrobiaceae bacterium]